MADSSDGRLELVLDQVLRGLKQQQTLSTIFVVAPAP